MRALVRSSKSPWPASALLIALSAAPALPAQQADSDEKPSDKKPSLAIVRLDLLDAADGYAIPADSVFFPGETIHLVFNITGYTWDDDYNMSVEYKITALGPSGRPFRMAEGGKFAVELAPQDEDWEPLVRYSAELPYHAESGEYRILIEVTDRMEGKTVSRQAAVAVEGAEVETSDELVVRNFAFARSDGGTRIAQPAFKPGETIWASFYITGYQTRADNTYEVEAELEVVDEEGETLHSFESRGEKGSPFYPRLWLPAKFSLKLDKTIRAGDYEVVLAVHDKVGGANYTTRQRFQVR